MKQARVFEGSRSVVGVLLAAGRGRRLGGTKQLIPWKTAEGVKPLVAASFDALCPACNEMIVVLGHEADRVASALEPREFTTVLADPDAEMIESLVSGLTAAFQSGVYTAALVQPADHPEVRPGTLRALLASHAESPGLAVIPRHAGSGGHPVLIPARLLGDIRAPAADAEKGGLRVLWKRRPDLCRHVEVQDPGISRDLDVPADLDCP